MQDAECACGCGEQAKPGNRYLPYHRQRSHPKQYDRYTVTPGPLETPCWLWDGYRDPAGYGRMSKSHAHILHYVRDRGPVPKGMELDHLCRNRACVNPEHLEPVPHAENVLRGGAAKLTRAEAREIRMLWDTGDHSAIALGQRYGVDRNTIYRLVRGRSWKGV